MKTITLLIPAYNEEEVLPTLFERLDTFAKSIKDYKFDFLFVNDGSRDKTMEMIRSRAETDKRVSYVNLSRNFGKEIAMIAGELKVPILTVLEGGYNIKDLGKNLYDKIRYVILALKDYSQDIRKKISKTTSQNSVQDALELFGLGMNEAVKNELNQITTDSEVKMSANYGRYAYL
jgi:cellulose synthase/poly-beta-1,6-N-acetylglucosamine synthase-like glycosyltransferase